LRCESTREGLGNDNEASATTETTREETEDDDETIQEHGNDEESDDDDGNEVEMMRNGRRDERGTAKGCFLFREPRDRFISTDRGSKRDRKQEDTGSEALR